MLLLTTGVYAQKQVFNVQQYCIDEKPFKQGQCDTAGNEYSFVFLNVERKEVVFYLTELKFQYQIIATKADATHMIYTLKNETGETTMTLNNARTKIEFFTPNRNIFLTVGKSTKGK